MADSVAASTMQFENVYPHPTALRGLGFQKPLDYAIAKSELDIGSFYLFFFLPCQHTTIGLFLLSRYVIDLLLIYKRRYCCKWDIPS